MSFLPPNYIRRIIYSLLLRLVLPIFIFTSSHAQQNNHEINQLFTSFSNPDTVQKNNSPFFIVRFDDKKCMDAYRTMIVRSFKYNLAVVRNCPECHLSEINSCLTEWSAANDLWKLSPPLMQANVKSSHLNDRINEYNIVADDIERLAAKMRVDHLSVEFISIYREGNGARIRCSEEVLFNQLLTYPELLFADLYSPPQTDILVSGYYRNINQLNQLEAYFPSANGAGVVIGIKEKNPDVLDIDLLKRVIPSQLADPASDNHATIVTTLAGGAGNSFITGRGVANQSKFFPFSFNNLFPDSTAVLLQNNVTVQNHSYGTIIQPFYGAEALGYDLQSFRQPNLLHVFSSGNQGNETSLTGTYANLQGFCNITGNFKMGKNVLTVAALDTGGRVAVFSSSGPLYDGRLGPQLAALGPNGTSEAAALVSGAAAVLQQLYRDNFNQTNAPSSLIRALLFNGADDVAAPGIDYKTGFGSMNLFHSAKMLQQRQFAYSQVGASDTWDTVMTIPTQATNLKVTLCWTDTPALVNSAKALVNDLDLELIHLSSGTVYKPWCLNVAPSVDSLQALPFRSRDSLNNAEQVSIELPEPGAYSVLVKAHELGTVNPQSFHLAWSVDTLNTFRFTNPITPDDVNPDEKPSLRISWETFSATPNATGNLSVSYNSGTDWREIGHLINLNPSYFFWRLPDTIFIVQWRMECSFGTFYSGQFVLAPLTHISVDYLCTDSLRLSWQKLPMASAYRIYGLGDSAYLSEYTIVSDTFLVTHRNSQTPVVYAVEPLLSNGIHAARSYAINVLKQGVDCYYQALVAETVGDYVKLSLSLSYLSGIDSLVFYRTSAAGVLQKRLQSLLPGITLTGYEVYDDEPSSGLNYYRVLIFTQGGIIYTEIASWLHNGKETVWAYPNPVRRGMPLFLLVREAAAESTMNIYNDTGKLLGNFPFNSAFGINTNPFSPGLYFYRLTGKNGSKLSAGKIIIQ